jgi:hypothetical protein
MTDTPTGEIAPQFETEIPDAFTATELVGLIAQAGPGSSLKVRSHHLPSGITKVGQTKWMSEYTNGPAIYHYSHPHKRDWIDSILPLGGETVYLGPPTSTTNLGDRRALPLVQSGYTNSVHTRPVNETAETKYRFELLDPDYYAEEEIDQLRTANGLDLDPADVSKAIRQIADIEAVDMLLDVDMPSSALVAAIGYAGLTENAKIAQEIAEHDDLTMKGVESLDWFKINAYGVSLYLETLPRYLGTLLSGIMYDGFTIGIAASILTQPIYDEGTAGFEIPHANGHSLLEIAQVDLSDAQTRLHRLLHGYGQTLSRGGNAELLPYGSTRLKTI